MSWRSISGEDVVLLVRRRRHDAAARREPQRVEARQIDDRRERPDVERARPAGRRPPADDLDELREVRARLVARGRFDLQPDDVAAAPLAQRLLDRLEERLAALVVELELGVAREAERGRLERRPARGRARRSRRG